MKYRMSLDIESSIIQLKNNNEKVSDCFPYYDERNKDKNIELEYFLVTQTLAEKGNYNDFFIRERILLLNLYLKIIKNYYHINVQKEWCDNKDFIICEKIDKEIVDELNKIKIYKGGFVSSSLNVSFLYNIICILNASKPNEEIDKMLPIFENIEKTRILRNDAAHEIRLITTKDINSSDTSIDIIINSIKKIIMLVYPDVKDRYFNIYKKINEDIKKLL